MKDLIASQHISRRRQQAASRGKKPYCNVHSIKPMKQRPLRSPIQTGGKSFSRKKPAPRRLEFSFAGLASLAFTVIVVGSVTLGALYLYQEPGFFGNKVVPQDDGVYENALASYAGLGPESAGAAAQPELQNGTEAAAEQSEEIPLDMTETFAWSEYTVKRGDSVSVIASRHSLSMDAIIASNNISNARQLREGQALRLPNMDGIPYTVKSGDTLGKIARNQGIPVEAILDANDLESELINAGTMLFLPGARMPSEDLKLALGELFIYPIRGRLSSPYGWRQDPISGVRRFHNAIDLAASTGTTIKAAMDGRIQSVGFNSTYGKYIIMTHGNNYQTMYAHLSLVSVEQGDAVIQGNKIGEVGSTGYSTGPHLHFAIYKNGRALNPLDFLNSSR